MGSSPSKREAASHVISDNSVSHVPRKETAQNGDGNVSKPEAPKPTNVGSAKPASNTVADDQSLERLTDRVVTAMNILNKTVDFSEGDVFTQFNEIILIFYLLTRSKRDDDLQKICSILISKGLLALFVRLWDYCHQNTEELYAQTDGTKFINLTRIKVIFWNYSDKCVELAKACYKNGEVIERLMREFTLPELAVPCLKQARLRHMMKANLGIFHNVVRLYSRNRDHLRKDGGIEKILAYEKSGYLIMKAKVFITVAYCINEDENEKLMTGRGVVEFIIQTLLKEAIQQPNHVAKSYAFSAEETVAALNKLASNDDNKKTLVEAGVLPFITPLLDQETSSRSEHLEALNCIWSLAFHPDNREKIIDEPDLLDRVKQLRNDFKSDVKMNKACSSIMFVLDLEQPAEEIALSGNKHIMLSYNWEVQVVMLQLRDFLRENGYNIWMDVEKMQDSILSAMADAVENAALILVAMTENYKHSNSCRTEAEYAYKREVPILPLLLQRNYVADGWLGAMVGTKLYVDLSAFSAEKFVDVKKQVEALISTAAKNERAVVPVASSGGNLQVVPKSFGVPNQVSRMTSVDGGSASLAMAVMPCKEWTVKEVQEWYRGTGLKDNGIFSDCDGTVLSQLCKLLLRSPDTYYLILRQEMHFSFKDMLIFTNAVEALLAS